MISIRVKVMTVAFASILAAVVTFAAVMVASLQSNSRAEETERLRRSVRAFNEHIELRQHGALAVLQTIAARPDVRSAIVQSDREALINLLTPIFLELQETIEIIQFYVHRPDGAVLLRLHDPGRRGDSYVSHRPMILDAVRTRDVVSGIELDAGQMSHRIVMPVMEQERITGLLEVGLEYDQTLLADMKERRGIDARIWLLLEAAAPSGVWPEGDVLDSPVPGMFLYASTFSGVRPLRPEQYLSVARSRVPVIEFLAEEPSFVVTAVPIVGYGEVPIGVLELSQSRAQAVASFRSGLVETVLVAAVVAAGGMLLLGFTLSIVVLRPLRGLTRAAHKQLDGDLKARAPRYSNDELGLLADTFNGLSNRLTQTLQQQRRTIQELGIARHSAEQANASKDQFLAALSHELRTPMTPVLLAIESLRSDPSLPASVQADLEMISRNVQLESRLIDDLLDLTRITQGKLELHLHKADLHSLINFAVSICRPDLDQKNIHLTMNLTAENTWVFADSPRLQQVIWNLLKNAVKFTSANGEVAVETIDEIDSSHVSLRVRDNGIGMAPETLSRIFQPFEQGGRDITRAFGGLGLGLVISKRIVELHGGTITAHSEGRSKGSEFVVRLPVVSPPEPTHDGGPKAHRAAAARPLRILMVEDHPSTADVLARVLRGVGHRVTVANTVKDAIAAAREQKHDLLISDLGLPDGSGTELVEHLRRGSSIRAIAISGYGMQDDIDRSTRAGFDVHLTKPITREVLLGEIDRLAAATAPA